MLAAFIVGGIALIAGSLDVANWRQVRNAAQRVENELGSARQTLLPGKGPRQPAAALGL